MVSTPRIFASLSRVGELLAVIVEGSLVKEILDIGVIDKYNESPALLVTVLSDFSIKGRLVITIDHVTSFATERRADSFSKSVVA